MNPKTEDTSLDTEHLNSPNNRMKKHGLGYSGSSEETGRNSENGSNRYINRNRSRSRSKSPTRQRNRQRSPSRERRTDRRSSKSSQDYSKLIPNFEQMSSAERVRAKMKLQLSQVSAKDKHKGKSGEWERAGFNKTAPLDDEDASVPAKEDVHGDGAEDTASLRNTSVSYLSYSSQLTKEKRMEAAHEAAIFGGSGGHNLVEESSKEVVDEKPQEELLSEEVIAMQKESWQERLRKIKASK